MKGTWSLSVLSLELPVIYNYFKIKSFFTIHSWQKKKKKFKQYKNVHNQSKPVLLRPQTSNLLAPLQKQLLLPLVYPSRKIYAHSSMNVFSNVSICMCIYTHKYTVYFFTVIAYHKHCPATYFFTQCLRDELMQKCSFFFHFVSV